MDLMTPKWILDNMTVEVEGEEVPRDVFDEIINDGNPYADIMKQSLWASYAYRAIGSCDLEYWVSAMRLRYYQIKDQYAVRFSVYDDFLSRFAEDGPDYSVGISEYETQTGDENNPQTPTITVEGGDVTDDVYLDRRSTTKARTRSFAGLDPATVREYADAVGNIGRVFAEEFSLQFAWVM